MALATEPGEPSFVSEETFTQEDFWRWLQRRPSSDVHHYELIRGRIVMTPPAGWPHGAVEMRLGSLIESHVRAGKLGVVQSSSAGFDLPSGDTLEPDLSFISSERLALEPAPTVGRFLRIVPNLVVEILSPSTARRDRGDKWEIYQQCGVEEYWLVDSRRREVTVYTLSANRYDAGTVITTGPIRSSVLPGLEVQIEELFEI